MTAASKTDLQNLLKRQQITASKMSEKGREFNVPTFGGGIDSKEIGDLTRQFSVMIDAGLPLVQCLEILAGSRKQDLFKSADQYAPRWWGRRLDAVRRHEGVAQGFRSAVHQHGGSGRDGTVFSTPFCSGCRSYIEKNVKLQRAVKSAMV